jgi:hypothetical protein
MLVSKSTAYFLLVLQSLSSVNAIVNVLDHGAVAASCDNDNAEDNTAAFQTAMDFAVTSSDFQVYAPPGCYRFEGNLQIPRGVMLSGSFTSVPSHTPAFGDTVLDDGTVLMPVAGRGDADGEPFVLVNSNSALVKLVIYHPEQICGSEIPAPYPYAISMIGNNPSVQDVEILNPYQGILANGANRHNIQRVQGQPLLIGVFVDQTYDIGRIQDVHFNPWYCQLHPFVEFQLVHGRAFVFARSDWEYVLNTFAFGYAVGYHFIKSDSGAMNGNFVGIGADLAVNASVLIDDLQPAGLLITNGEFTAFRNDDWLPNGTAQSTHVVVSETNTGPVNIVNSAFWGPSHSIADVSGTGAASFSACSFVEWSEQDGIATAPALNVRSGKLSVTGSIFQQAEKVQLEMGEGVAVIATGNFFAGKKNWVDNGAVIQEGFNSYADSSSSSSSSSGDDWWMTVGCSALVSAVVAVLTSVGVVCFTKRSSGAREGGPEHYSMLATPF